MISTNNSHAVLLVDMIIHATAAEREAILAIIRATKPKEKKK
jgi:hypothetical protein